MQEPTEIDWARLAAFIDGEGCITIGQNQINREGRAPIMYVDVRIANTDPRLPTWLKEKFGGSITVNRQNDPRWSTNFSWYVGSTQAIRILTGCLPYFVIKRDQAEVALSFQRTVTRKWGVKGRPQSVVEIQLEHKRRLQTLKGNSSRARTMLAS